MFELDPFQLDAIAALDRSESVLVAAPTGAGKTVVADAAIDMALHSGGRTIYTTPIKALSNQKFNDLCHRLGPDGIGLLTGDNSIRPHASVVVMTTEVLRNMMYAASPNLDDVHAVVLDEVHYLEDRYRGSVWEEVIIGLPEKIRLVCLSATVSNVDELGQWIRTVRGPVTTIVETERPVELRPLYLVGDRSSDQDHLLPILVDGRPNAEGFRFDPDRQKGRSGKPVRRFRTPRKLECVERLAEEDLLPAIYFVFSRAGCDEALAHTRDAGIRLTDTTERERIRAILDEATSRLSDSDLEVLDFGLWAEGVERGIATHHAGMIPAFKEAVERCFVEGLVKVVFATETLALGINMPARSVVIDKLTKYNGETHEFLSPSQFTQFTGRAGRRGIDDVGYAIVTWSPFVSFDEVSTLAASRSFPLNSSFRPTYNMAAQLIRRFDRDEALSMLGQSFAQFQSDRSAVGDERRLARLRDTLAETEFDEDCDCGSVADHEAYDALRRRVRSERRQRRRHRSSLEEAMSLLRPGEVIDVPCGPETSPDTEPRPQRLAVISVAYRGKGVLRVRGVDADGDTRTLGPDDLDAPPRPVATIALPEPYSPSAPAFLDGVATSVAALGPPRSETAATGSVTPLEAERDAHPTHSCPRRNDHLDALGRRRSLENQIAKAEASARRRSGSIVTRFERIVDLMRSLGTVEDWSLTASGETLARIYHERDLLVALALHEGVFDGVDPSTLAALVASVTFEERRSDTATRSLPTDDAAARFTALEEINARLVAQEKERGLPRQKPLHQGFATSAHRWAEGGELAMVIDDDVSGGDFVRNIRLVVDLVRQIAEVAHDPGTRRAAAAAAEALHRGVVAVDSVDIGSTGGEP